MNKIEKRLEELKLLGAGDSMCAKCLSIEFGKIEVCKMCIAETPKFTELMSALCKMKAEGVEVPKEWL